MHFLIRENKCFKAQEICGGFELSLLKKNRCDVLLSRQSRSENVAQFVRVRDDKTPAGMTNSS